MNMNQRKHHMKSTVALKVDGVSYEHHAALAEQLNATIKERDAAEALGAHYHAQYTDLRNSLSRSAYRAERRLVVGIVVAFIAGLATGLINLFVNL